MAFDAETRAALIEQVRRFVTETCVPVEAQVGEEDAVPQHVIDEMKALGLFGIAVPEEYGGLDLDMETECLVAMELGKTSPAFRSVAGTNIGIGSQALILFGTEAQKAKWLPGVASGDLIASFALTEPEAGSDAAGLKTRATRDGDHYILNGTKRYITNANKADLFTVMARTNPDEPGAKGVSAFIVERGTLGLSVGKPEKKMGQQGAHICDVIFENARVPAENLIAKEGEGFKVAMSVLDKGRLHISAVATGVSKRLIREMVTYALERKQFGKPIFEHQMLQALIADSQAETYAAECMILDAARRRDAGEDVTMLASCTKLFATEACGRVADRAVQIFGGAGYVTDYGIERFYRDVRIFRLYEGTSQIQQIIIARELARAAKAGML
ncbi:MAG: acyl-CoA dehydrogenase [Hyphomonas sp.]|uniref:acyl-CoA dehydrogenase family protein n=1 Tax=Hyphomonas sp. TaxID=87 RepID=UPI0017E1B738|nr:acyl-CoA dehydrogenase family protein [Hyphomonas sp.]MBA3067042.1 acyl-CoA dehydrogenase [Hyphomonas sp.]MBU3921650.1 acyl-CoA dehydrogenase family protein [Alphaproteobacteria bacterium]MBU4063163.1 acyl-CoA dehydrogenase family protein [Alphaproteobacteria bacterium]MBU4164480.1 acyl-CoA dehydrogenase family protein [Alphaproteobacteria bacterium]